MTAYVSARSPSPHLSRLINILDRILSDRVYLPLEDQVSEVYEYALESVCFWSARTSGIPHWRTSYKLRDYDGSGAKKTLIASGISVDMFQPAQHVFNKTEAHNLFGSLLIMPVNKLVSTRTTIECNYTFKKPITVADLLAFIKHRKLQYYKFHNEGSGCMLSFQLTILEHLEAMGYIESGSKEDAVSRIIQYKEEVRADMLYPPVQALSG